MELLQIISFSVKIFALITAIIVLLSYLIYKLKDRKRNKPYSKIAAQHPGIDLSGPELQFNQEQYSNLQQVNAPAENLPYENQQYENVQYQNVQYEKQPIAVYQNNQPRSFGQRFKILNEDNNNTNQKTHLIEKLQAATVAPQKFNTSRQTQVFNIYDYYSKNNYEPMHKIKL